MLSTSVKQASLVFMLGGLAHGCDRHRAFRRDITPRVDTPRVQLNSDEQTLFSSVDNVTLDQWSYYYTHGDHIAGKNKTMAVWTADRFADNGWDASLVSYEVYLNYPVENSLSLHYGNGSEVSFDLNEAALPQDDTTTWPDSIPAFHGYSASGEVSAEYVYVGRGSQADYQRLVDLGIDLEGKIALSMYGGLFRGLKIKNAQSFGMVGAVLFLDPGDDGEVTEANGYAAYPEGPARQPSSTQRGSVQFLSSFTGDPTTPGYPSKKGVEREDPGAVTPNIPSLPISYENAIPILAALNGHGLTAKEVNQSDWSGALNVSYSTGPASGLKMTLKNQMEDGYYPIWNAVGVINGTNADETIVIGNHRDAWIIGGAADPNSGTAIIVELSKAFGKLLSQGWKPRRNIVLCSWDAEEYGIVGSTEWVEEYIPWLNNTAISYINIDVGASGPTPYIDASPELHSVASDTMRKIPWMATNRTMYDVWMDATGGEPGVLGSGSDYTAFVHNGIGSIDMGATNGDGDPVYHYHSNYDSYHWMATYGDPGFLAHKSMCQYMSLLAYRLSSQEIVPLNVTNWAVQMDSYFSDLQEAVASASSKNNNPQEEDSSSSSLDLSPLRSAIDKFSSVAADFDKKTSSSSSSSSSKYPVAVPNLLSASEANARLRDFQRGFVSQGGLPGREFYRNLIFAPGLDTGYAAATFPGITEAVEGAGSGNGVADWDTAREFVGKTADAILVAAGVLEG